MPLRIEGVSGNYRLKFDQRISLVNFGQEDGSQLPQVEVMNRNSLKLKYLGENRNLLAANWAIIAGTWAYLPPNKQKGLEIGRDSIIVPAATGRLLIVDRDYIFMIQTAPDDNSHWMRYSFDGNFTGAQIPFGVRGLDVPTYQFGDHIKAMWIRGSFWQK